MFSFEKYVKKKSISDEILFTRTNLKSSFSFKLIIFCFILTAIIIGTEKIYAQPFNKFSLSENGIKKE